MGNSHADLKITRQNPALYVHIRGGGRWVRERVNISLYHRAGGKCLEGTSRRVREYEGGWGGRGSDGKVRGE